MLDVGINIDIHSTLYSGRPYYCTLLTRLFVYSIMPVFAELQRSPSQHKPDRNNPPMLPLTNFADRYSRNLHSSLQSLSLRLLSSSLNASPSYAPLLSRSIRRHFIHPSLLYFYRLSDDAFHAPAHATPPCLLETTVLVQALLDSLLQPRPICHAYNQIIQYLFSLPSTDSSSALLRNLWADLLVPFRAHLTDWLAFAEVHDANNQFFISTHPHPCILPSNLPSFIPKPVAERILRAGLMRQAALQLARGHRSFVLLGDEEKWYERLGVPFLQEPLHAELQIDASSMTWEREAGETLGMLVPYEQVRRKVELLRGYLLLGHAMLWRSFFEELRKQNIMLGEIMNGDLEESERTRKERMLKRVYQTAVAESGEEQDAAEVGLDMRVSKEGKILTAFEMNYTEGVVLKSRASVYCDLFAVVFNVRRVAFELREAFRRLNRIEAELRGRGRWRGVTGKLVKIVELRRKMGLFVDALEWYLQVEVIGPKFESLVQILDKCLERKKNGDGGCFGEVKKLHENLLDGMFNECFVANEQIDKRLHAIFEACFSLCDFVGAISVESLRVNNYGEAIKEMNDIFTRNVALLVRLLTHVQRGRVDSAIPAFLVRIRW